MTQTSGATIKEIAQRADVSVATVSRVLNNHVNVRESVRERGNRFVVRLRPAARGAGLPSADRGTFKP